MAGGDTPREDLFDGIKEGLVVEQLLGAGQGNELGGDFKANVALGYRIENGEDRRAGQRHDDRRKRLRGAQLSRSGLSGSGVGLRIARDCQPYVAGAFR